MFPKGHFGEVNSWNTAAAAAAFWHRWDRGEIGGD